MRGEKPVNLRQLQEEVQNKKDMWEGAQNRYRKNIPDATLERIAMREAEYQEASARLMALPPPPVLPPICGLCKITGELEAFSRQRCQADFEVDFYRTNPLPNASDAQRLAGSPALGALLASEDKPLVSTADYIQGQIKGMPFRGWVGMTDLKAGDEVEMVAEWQTDHYEVYAIAYPAERIISVCPECEMGRYAYGWLRVKYMFILFLFFMMLFCFGMSSVIDGDYLTALRELFNMQYYGELWAIAMVIYALIAIVIAISAYKAYAPTTCKLAEDIFRTMGWASPEKIDLNKTTARHERRLKRQGKWYSPKRKDKPLRPTSKWAGSFEYWYYY
ncbi:hypothetical protein CYR55_05935 [Chimaeribacter californicus]|uniref:Uncharacterized protein n=1 Tax=Chimaeribacter californicus TaxID=2060067 RepID=A0A2N5EE86_9GAMM|nr:putative type VI secretion system effector [Chimaeribacter californicus]PLR40816.1 hypothetical protein CYR55_05935 [Chimaeribacter californicus]